MSLLFLSAQIRTGSTFLWHLFKSSEEFTAYFEPDLMNLFDFMKFLPAPLARLHHYHVDSYWDEYRKLEDLPERYVDMVKEIRTKFCLAPDDKAPAFKRYLDYLIDSAEQRPMLQFNRCEFRLLWLRSQYPKSTIIHLWRNPRDQWASMFMGARPQYIVADFKKKIPYLCKVFPVLAAVKNLYQFHFLYHRISNIAGQAHANIAVSFDDLRGSPHRSIERIFDSCNVQRMTVKQAVDLLVTKQRKGTDLHQADWYARQESICEEIWAKEYGAINPVDAINTQIQLANADNSRDLCAEGSRKNNFTF